MSPTPVYFEESWAILSSIGLINMLFGMMVIGITNLSPISLVPIIVSAAGAMANGMSYYAFYANYNTSASITAAVFADLGWLIQEAGLSFYSYLILIRVLKNRARTIFLILFWSVISIIAILRLAITISRAHNIRTGNNDLQSLVSRLHIGYFVSIAVVEIISSFFLLRKFVSASRTSIEASSTSGLFRYLIRSTEIRLASLALIGVTRSITYSFQRQEQSASNVASQVDRFVFTLECTFPMMMFIDILASKVVVSNHLHNSSSHTPVGYHKSANGHIRQTGGGDLALYSINNTETRIDAHGHLSSSQERIVDGDGSREGTVAGEGGGRGINKTVEFEFHESTV